MKRKRVLVLSGGGAKIGFQAGVTSCIDRNFDATVGVSCGAIWAAMIAQGKQFTGEALILSLSNDNIYTGSFSITNIIKRLITRKNYILDMSPLRRLLEENVRKEDFIIPAYFVYVDAETGEKIVACSDTLDTNGIIDAIMSSSAIPVAMRGVNDRYYDGGLEEVCPLKEAIDLQPDEIVIINCFNRNEQSIRTKNSLISTAAWSFTEKMPTVIAKYSINPFLAMNELVKDSPNGQKTITVEGKQKTIKYFDYQLFEPKQSLGDSFDFSHEQMKKRYLHGVRTAI